MADSLRKQERQNKIRDEINEKEGEHKILYENIQNKLMDKTLVGQTMEMTMANPADAGSVKAASPSTKVAGSNESHISDPFLYGGESLAPKNMPVHIQKDDFKPAVVSGTSVGGIVTMKMTIDSEDIALHFIKKLFKQGLISKAQMKPGNMHRTYLKFGQIHTESGKYSLELTTPATMAASLIDYIDTHNPNPYDYPVPNMIAQDINSGNPAYIQSIKADINLGKNLKMDEVDDQTNVIDLQINETKPFAKK